MSFLAGMFFAVSACVSALDEQTPSPVLEEYKSYLQSLDGSDFHSIGQARNQYLKLLGTQDIATRDAGFVLFRDFFRATAGKAMERLRKEHEAETSNQFTARIDSPDFRKDLRKHGLDVFDELGDAYFDEMPDFLLSTFSKYVSPAVTAFLKLRKPELAEGFNRDAGLVISHERLGERVIAWERYRARYPKSILSKDAQYFYDTYLGVFLIGLDNSRVFDYAGTSGGEERYLISEETRLVFQNFMKKYPAAESGKIVAAFYTLAEKNGFRMNREVMEFIRAKNIPWTLGWSPHLR